MRRGWYVSKEELREKVFYYHCDSNSLEVLISRIRKKLGSKHIIKSVKGLGYMVVENSEALLRPGLMVDVYLQLGKIRGLWLPAQSLQRLGEDYVVFVKTKEFIYPHLYGLCKAKLHTRHAFKPFP